MSKLRVFQVITILTAIIGGIMLLNGNSDGLWVILLALGFNVIVRVLRFVRRD